MAHTSRGADSDEEEEYHTIPDDSATLIGLLSARAPRPRKRASEDAEINGTLLTVLSTEKFDQDRKNLDTDRTNFNNEMRVQTMGFTVTVKELSATQSWTRQEAEYMVEKYGHVQQGKVGGEDGGLLTRLKNGMKNSHGWLVYARALNDLAPAEGDTYGVPKDAMIGVLLITSTQKGWEGKQPLGDGAVKTRMADVNAMATHHLKRKQGVAKEMWKAFESAIIQDDELNAQPGGPAVMPFKITVNANNCLNNPDAKSFYTKCGFNIPPPEGKGKKTPDELNGYIMYDKGEFVGNEAV